MTIVPTSPTDSRPVIALRKIDGRNRRAARTREMIIQAARHMVAHEKPLTVVAVAKLADVSVRSVFQHFGDVDSLSRHLRTAIIKDVTERVAEITARKSSWPRGFEERVAFAVEQLRDAYFGRSNAEADQIRFSVAWAFDGPRLEMEDSEAVRKFYLALEKLLILGLFKEEYNALQDSLEKREMKRQARARAMIMHLLWPRTFWDFMFVATSDGGWKDLQHVVVGVFLHLTAEAVLAEQSASG